MHIQLIIQLMTEALITEWNGEFSHVNNISCLKTGPIPLFMKQLTFSLLILYFLTIALSRNMVKNRDFILTLKLYEKWDKKTLTAHLTSTSFAKSFVDRNSLTLCLHTESAGTDILVSEITNFGKIRKYSPSSFYRRRECGEGLEGNTNFQKTIITDFYLHEFFF